MTISRTLCAAALGLTLVVPAAQAAGPSKFRQVSSAVSQRLKKNTRRAADRWQRTSPRKRRAAATGVALGLIATTVGGTLAYNGAEARRLWADSPASSEFNAATSAASSNDLVALDNLGRRVDDRVTSLQNQVNLAKTTGKKINGKSKKDLERELAFARFSAAYVQILENQASTNPIRRAGGQLPEQWISVLDDLERAAEQSGSEGTLAWRLDDLAHEVSEEENLQRSASDAIDEFDDLIPRAFSGEAKDNIAKARVVIKHLNHEIVVEDQTLGKMVREMRDRISNRLADKSPAFAQTRARSNDLKVLDSAFTNFRTIADQVDNDLGNVVSYRQQEQLNYALALQHTSDRQVTWVTDSNGKLREKVTYVDNSGTYRAMAAIAASNARNAGSNAQKGLAKLGTLLPGLAQNTTLAAEGLSLPPSVPQLKNIGQGGWEAYILPTTWSLYTSIGDSAAAANIQGELRGFRTHMSSTHGAIEARSSQALSEVEQEIDDELRGDKAKVVR